MYFQLFLKGGGGEEQKMKSNVIEMVLSLTKGYVKKND
jgi:hypothetical protein